MKAESRARGVVRDDGKVYGSVAEAAADNDCHQSAIYAVCSGKRKQAGGFGWSYAESARDPGKRPTKFTLYFGDEDKANYVRTALVYESAIRGVSLSQALVEIVTDAIDPESYPEEMTTALVEIKDKIKKNAALKALEEAG